MKPLRLPYADDKSRHVSHQRPLSDVLHETRPNAGFLGTLSAPGGGWIAPTSGRELHGEVLDRQDTDMNDTSDWLNLSLKALSKPVPNCKDIRREDLKLSLDMADSMECSPVVTSKVGIPTRRNNAPEPINLSPPSQFRDARYSPPSGNSVVQLDSSTDDESNDQDRASTIQTTRRGYPPAVSLELADSMDCFVKSGVSTSTGQNNPPTLAKSLAQNRQGRLEYRSPIFGNNGVEILELSDDETNSQEKASTVQARPSICSNKFGTSEHGLSSHVHDPQNAKISTKHSSLEHLISLNHKTPVVELSDSSAIPEGPRLELASVVSTRNVSSVPLRNINAGRSPQVQAKLLSPRRSLHNQIVYPHVCKSNTQIVELSDSLSTHSDESENDLVFTSDVRQVLGVKFSKPSQVLDNSRTSHYVQDTHRHEGFYTKDVACCSTKPPPTKTNRVAYTTSKFGEFKYVQNKDGTLIQVFEVGDSDTEGEGDNLQKKCDPFDVDVLFDNHERGADCTIADPSTETDKNRILDVFRDIHEVLKIRSEDCSNQNQEPERSPTVSVKSRQLSHTSLEASIRPHRSKLRKLVLEESGSNDSDESRGEPGREAGGAMTKSVIEPKLWERWKHGIQCDLCNRGPSLTLGEWFSWCCGLPASKCQCAEAKKLRKKMAIGYRKAQKTKRRGNKIYVVQWSGKVHKMCALWSSEVFEQEYSKKENHLRSLDAAVKRGNSLSCGDAECKKAGATLGCRVKNCRRSYHYPCAEKLASGCLLRMWDGLTVPIACMNHRHVEGEVDRAKEKLFPGSIADIDKDGKKEWRHYLGIRLLSEDIAEGQEIVRIPCTNDVDDDSLPRMKYITKCWSKGQPVDNLHPDGTKLAQGCQGCDGPEFDDAAAPMSVHVLGTDGSRESDKRLDWQSEYMYGRLAYNAHGLLQVGTEAKDIVECNSRCMCGPKCRNQELQKGLQVRLELFKTTDRGWGVRSLEQIPRGRFVVEYVGDVLTQAEADEKAEKYDQNQLSYLFNLDHPGVDHEDAIVLDGIHMSNIARFINHSCEGNLMIYRVYSETTELRYFRIGMYAIQDIEVGEELSYDYNYAVSKESNDLQVDDPTAIRCCCGAQSCRKWLWRGGS